MAETPEGVKVLLQRIDEAISYAMQWDGIRSLAKNPIEIRCQKDLSNGGYAFYTHLIPWVPLVITEKEVLQWKFNSVLPPPTTPIPVQEQKTLICLCEDALLQICRKTGHGAVILTLKYKGNIRYRYPDFVLIWYWSNCVAGSLIFI